MRRSEFEKVEFVCDVETREELNESTKKKDESKENFNNFYKKLIENGDINKIAEMIKNEKDDSYYATKIGKDILKEFGKNSKEFEQFVDNIEYYERISGTDIPAYALKDKTDIQLQNLVKDKRAFEERNSKEVVSIFDNGKIEKLNDRFIFITKPMVHPSEYFKHNYMDIQQRTGKYDIEKDDKGYYIKTTKTPDGEKIYLPDEKIDDGYFQEKKDEKTKKNDFLKILNNKELIEDIDRRNRKLSSPGKETVPIKEQLRDISEKLDKTDNSELKAVFENFETDVSKFSSVGEFEDSLENKIRAFNLIYSRVNNEKSKEED